MRVKSLPTRNFTDGSLTDLRMRAKSSISAVAILPTTQPGAERLQNEWMLRHYSPHSVRSVSGWSTRSIPEAMLERPLFFVSTPG